MDDTITHYLNDLSGRTFTSQKKRVMFPGDITEKTTLTFLSDHTLKETIGMYQISLGSGENRIQFECLQILSETEYEYSLKKSLIGGYISVCYGYNKKKLHIDDNFHVQSINVY